MKTVLFFKGQYMNNLKRDKRKVKLILVPSDLRMPLNMLPERNIPTDTKFLTDSKGSNLFLNLAKFLVCQMPHMT